MISISHYRGEYRLGTLASTSLVMGPSKAWDPSHFRSRLSCRLRRSPRDVARSRVGTQERGERSTPSDSRRFDSNCPFHLGWLALMARNVSHTTRFGPCQRDTRIV